MKPNLNTETIAAKLPKELADAIWRAAREDDRTVSQWMRRHFAEYFKIYEKPTP